MCNGRDFLKDKKRIVVKIGSSSLMHSETGKLDLYKENLEECYLLKSWQH